MPHISERRERSVSEGRSVAEGRSISEDNTAHNAQTHIHTNTAGQSSHEEMRKADHKRLIRLENRVDHSIILLEKLSRQMIDMMGMVKHNGVSTHHGHSRRLRKASMSGNFEFRDVTPRTTENSAVVIQKLWRGYTTRNPIFPRSRMSSMSDDVTFTSPVQSHAPGGRLMTRTTSGRFAWSEADGNPILGPITSGEPVENDAEYDQRKEEEGKKLKDVELIEMSRSAPKTNKIFPEGFQQKVPTPSSLSNFLMNLPCVWRMFGKKNASEREVITNSDGSYQVIENKRVVHYVLEEDSSWMINPKGSFRLTWDFCCITPLLIYLAVMMPFRLCFANEPQTFSVAYWLEFMIDIIEYDLVRVRYNYGTTWFPLDLASGIPFSLIELLFATGPTSNLKTLKTVRLIRFIKLGRLFKIEKILTSMDRDTLDRVEDFFQNNNTRSALVIIGLAIKTGFVCHLLSCLWVFIGRQGSQKNVDNWLANDMKGPFDFHDTYNDSPYVGQIYLAAFYFCFTTMSSVGYGDIVAANSMERIFAILLEFTGSLVFATIIAALTSVVTSMDMNQRKIAEQLDSVASFVVNRNFPDALGRRIRRHFRHFYSLKSAIDESKIFGELSTSLRKEVSAYLVSELMGDVSLFTSMSPLLWPHLLPILRPMRFEAEEIVCRQDEQCREMYVVLSGKLVGTTILVGEESKVRRITGGDTINVLCVLGIWTKCVETVVADVSVETYAISEKDFGSLFLSEADLLTFEEMKQREVYNFKMDTSIKCDADAQLEFGKPLYLCVFSRLDLIIVGAEGLAATGFDGLSDTYAVAEIVNLKDGKLISKSFTFKTATIDNTNSPAWMEGFQWMDIPGAFDKLALRISIFDSDFVGLDTFMGMIEVPFTQLLKECTLSLINKGHMNTPPSQKQLHNSNKLATVPSLNLKEDDDRSMDSFGDKLSHSMDLESGPPSEPNSGGTSSKMKKLKKTNSNGSFSKAFSPPAILSPIYQEKGEDIQENNKVTNSVANTIQSNLSGIGQFRLSRSNSNSSNSSSRNSSQSNMTNGGPLLTSIFGNSERKSNNKDKRSHALVELPKLQPGHVQKWYELKSRGDTQSAEKGMYKSWNGKVYPSKKLLAQQRRHPDFQGSHKQSLSISKVTGSIQLRYHVRRAERDTIEPVSMASKPRRSSGDHKVRPTSNSLKDKATFKAELKGALDRL